MKAWSSRCFVATESVMIKIYGPNYIDGLDNSIFFTNMLLQKMPRYTPTLKYTNRGLFVLDTDDETLQNKYVDIYNMFYQSHF